MQVARKQFRASDGIPVRGKRGLLHFPVDMDYNEPVEQVTYKYRYLHFTCPSLMNSGGSSSAFRLCWQAAMMKTVEQLLDEARALLPYRLSPEETWQAIRAGTLAIDIRGAEQQREDGLVPGSLVIRRNVLEWRCDPASPRHHPRITHHGQMIVIICDQGYQSSLAAANLQQLGLTQATDMIGGFCKWKEAHLPIAAYDQALVFMSFTEFDQKK
jgi:rhodanese-related sulfurtransferase